MRKLRTCSSGWQLAFGAARRATRAPDSFLVAASLHLTACLPTWHAVCVTHFGAVAPFARR